MNVCARQPSEPVPSHTALPGTDNVNAVAAVATGSGVNVGAGCGPGAANVVAATTSINTPTNPIAAPPRNTRLRRDVMRVPVLSSARDLPVRPLPEAWRLTPDD